MGEYSARAQIIQVLEINQMSWTVKCWRINPPSSFITNINCTMKWCYTKDRCGWLLRHRRQGQQGFTTRSSQTYYCHWKGCFWTGLRFRKKKKTNNLQCCLKITWWTKASFNLISHRCVLLQVSCCRDSATMHARLTGDAANPDSNA